MKKLSIILSLLMLLSFTACSSKSDPYKNLKTEKATSQEEFTMPDVTKLTEEEYVAYMKKAYTTKEPMKNDTIAVMETTMGNITIRLFPEVAPKAVENFIGHANSGYYEGIIFHRVMDNFMIQGGDPTGTGYHGESIWGEPFEDEFSPLALNFRGALSMANSGPNTNGSQFFIVQNPELPKDFLTMLEQMVEKGQYDATFLEFYKEWGGYPSLDGVHTVFGAVIDGMDVVDSIAKVETDANDKPLSDIKINKITVTKYE